MLDMPRPRKPYVQREISRHGKVVWYFRRGDGPRIRLPGEYEGAEWLAAYDRAYSGAPAPKPSAAPHGSLRWLVDMYKASGRFALLSPETQEMRRRVLDKVCETGGGMRFAGVTAADIVAGRVRREATPYAAMNYVKIMGQLFGFAVDAGYLTENPAANVDRSAPATDGHHVWTVEEVERYQAFHPVGTRARLAMDLLLYTGFRRADAVKLGRQHIKDGVIRYRTTKGKGIEVVIPLLKPLADSIAATKTGDLAFLVTEFNRPWAKESFGTWFAEQCKAAGVPGRAHGLRKAGATFAANNGANEYQLAAMFGWKNPRMAEVYTRKVNRTRLAEQAANSLSPYLISGAGIDPSGKRAGEA
jgi:integrase